jgi:hypothetical protein
VGPKWVFTQGFYQIGLAELKPQSGFSRTQALTEGPSCGQSTCCKPGSPHRSDPPRAHSYKIFGALLCCIIPYGIVLQVVVEDGAGSKQESEDSGEAQNGSRAARIDWATEGTGVRMEGKDQYQSSGLTR